MKYENAVFSCIEYIEKNIKDDLTAEIIADEVGYSLYHFSRIFKGAMGMPLMEYVKERRLICASKEIFEGKKIIDVAIAYGYQTHSGFTKAFKKKFDFPPMLIHAMRLSCCMLNEKGGTAIMSDYSVESKNIFIKQSREFISPEGLYQELVESIKSRGLFNELGQVERAYHLAECAHQGETRKSGEPYIIHPLAVAIILAEMEADEEIIIAGLLHEVIEKDTNITLGQVAKEFSHEVASLVESVTVFNRGILCEGDSDQEKKVMLIKLADRLHNMRTIQYMEPEKMKVKAKETIEFFSPIANKLGISKIKIELDDLALKYL